MKLLAAIDEVEWILLNKNNAYINVNMTKIKVDRGEKKCLKLTRKYQTMPSTTANSGKSKLFKSMFITVVVFATWFGRIGEGSFKFGSILALELLAPLKIKVLLLDKWLVWLDVDWLLEMFTSLSLKPDECSLLRLAAMVESFVTVVDDDVCCWFGFVVIWQWMVVWSFML